MRMTKPASSVTLTEITETQLGRISRNRMCASLAPANLAASTYSSLRSELTVV